ncbi:hypothetical protein ACT9XH_07325 [Methanococcoides methylutens]|uniref:hypothetical protein n=1 Tax=Methanococcoides methylutens TaxID=2226 RepID=UPI004043BA81
MLDLVFDDYPNKTDRTILEDDYEYIVVSPETYPVALKINELRKANGKTEIKTIRIEYVMGDDDIPICSTRILHRHLK